MAQDPDYDGRKAGDTTVVVVVVGVYGVTSYTVSGSESRGLARIRILRASLQGPAYTSQESPSKSSTPHQTRLPAADQVFKLLSLSRTLHTTPLGAGSAGLATESAPTPEITSTPAFL